MRTIAASLFRSESRRGTRLRACALLGLLPLAIAACGTDDVEADDEPVDENAEAALTKRCARGESLKGIDVSAYQTEVDFNRVRSAGYRFAIARTSFGFKTDEYFAKNWQNMKRAGLVRGIYHYFHANGDGAAQANLMLDILDRAGGLAADDLPPAIDIEKLNGVSPSQMMIQARKWIDTVKRRTGRQPIIYTNEHWESEYGNPSNQGLPLWYAYYRQNITCPDIPRAWNEWAFWQHSETGRVPGVTGANGGNPNVDLNYFNGSMADLQAFIRRSRIAGSSSSAGDGSACGSVTAAGTCSGTVVRRCVSGRVESYDCSRNGLKCGWSASAGRNDCI